MRVLVACEFSGVVRDAFLDRGHDAWSCDLQYSVYRPSRGRHIQGNVRPLLKDKWDLVIAHPPCTYLTRAATRARRDEGEARWKKTLKAVEFFKLCLDANASKVAVENPVMFNDVKELIGQDYSQIIHPYQFGHPESKATCLWLKGLPNLVPTKVVDSRPNKLWRGGGSWPSAWRGLQRSITYQGIADAMADQWGNL